MTNLALPKLNAPPFLEPVMNFQEGLVENKPIERKLLVLLASLRSVSFRAPGLQLDRRLLSVPKIAQAASEQAVRAAKVHNTL